MARLHYQIDFWIDNHEDQRPHLLLQDCQLRSTWVLELGSGSKVDLLEVQIHTVSQSRHQIIEIWTLSTLLSTNWQILPIPWHHSGMLYWDWDRGQMGIRPRHCRFRGATGTTLLHPPPPLPSRLTVQQDYTVPPPSPPSVQPAPRAGAFVLHGQTETMPHSIVAPAPIIDDTQARIDRIEQRIRSLHVSDGVIGWDGYDDLLVAALPVEFRMLDIER